MKRLRLRLTHFTDRPDVFRETGSLDEIIALLPDEFNEADFGFDDQGNALSLGWYEDGK